ncbi:hypothetical protein [Aureimonas sp. AU4]|uniref:hypothetical protein n=1 Tax=Aureimonas sp. AU4 TaxID=1638163 RepID=UPI000783D8D0|nr:hypothetical protein [Aureimonas sp. AU4]
MANLTAVLRKTIDGLPNATPQLRAKVYEKARSAITRQIQAANPPLEPHVAEARYRVLEDAIRETESHYGGDVEPAAAEEPAAHVAPSEPEPATSPEPAPPPPAPERAPERPAFPRVTPTARNPAPAEPAFEAAPQRRDEAPLPVRRAEPPRAAPPPPAPLQRRDLSPSPAEAEDRVGEIGPAPREGTDRRSTPPARAGALRPAREEPRGDDGAPYTGLFAGIPEADLEAPRRTKRRAPARSGSRRPALVAGSALVLIAGLGAAAYFYGDEIRGVLTGSGASQVASTPTPAGTTDAGETPADTNGEAPATAAPPSGAVTDTAPAAPVTGGARPRQFTQRLLPDGSEVDEGPGTSVANAFEEGTDVAAASPAEPGAPAAASATPAPATTTPAAPPAPAVTASNQSVPVGQRAVFYEERATNREGSQQNGNVVWSLVSEPPADGQPAEPAIRGVVDVPQDKLKMTLTIRRNADATLPASHVIEIMFDTPADFPGGDIANVQRLALKPTEQARGEPLIGVAGKISPGFFIIALNDLPQAIQSNLGLLGREQWIDIPLAYESGQRALMSVEKGLPGERVFKQAMDAWAAKT